MLSLEMLETIWTCPCDHTQIPAQKAMNYHFEKSSSKKFCGRPMSNSLHNDIIMLKKGKKFNNRYNNINELKSFIDLESFKIAGARKTTVDGYSERHLCCCQSRKELIVHQSEVAILHISYLYFQCSEK